MNIKLCDDVNRIATKVVFEYGALGNLSFAYGQGSVFAGFVETSDLDINLVWMRSCGGENALHNCIGKLQ